MKIIETASRKGPESVQRFSRAAARSKLMSVPRNALIISVVNKFDVRPFPPAKRHDMVFEAFDELNPGEAFVFINDHDPKPLYYQMEAENDVAFNWEYLEVMPEEWKVKVMKLNTD